MSKLITATSLILAACTTAQADIQEIASQEMNQSFIPGISIPKTLKGARCATPTKKAGSECLAEEELKRSALVKEDSGQASVSSPVTDVSIMERLPSLNAPLHTSIGLPGTGVAVQSGQQVQIQILSPIPLSGAFSSPSVNMISAPGGTVLKFNLPR